jgi:hypothetical protein
MTIPPTELHSRRSLRDQVDELLPNWQSWYPSLFDAATDLGLLRARVCDLSSLVLSNRHAHIYNEAVQAFRNQWSVEEPEDHSTTDADKGAKQRDNDALHTPEEFG